jgi:glycosyltransferase involved in cell wall biosynthesis
MRLGAGAPFQEDSKVAVVITTYNHAHFLRCAIESVLAQTRQCDELIVVDDGSEDKPELIVTAYPAATLIRQRNCGPAAARNAGWRASTCNFFIFLDADDRLLPRAISAGLSGFASEPNSGFVYGGHRRIGLGGEPLAPDVMHPIGDYPYRRLLGGNVIGMNATVMFRRACLVAVQGFDEALRHCEDYDLYLRVAKEQQVSSHHEIIAEYRWHGGNTSGDEKLMLRAALAVLNRHKFCAHKSSADWAAWRYGRAYWREYYGNVLLRRAVERWERERKISRLVRDFLSIVQAAPGPTATRITAYVLRRFGLKQPPSRHR